MVEKEVRIKHDAWRAHAIAAIARSLQAIAIAAVVIKQAGVSTRQASRVPHAAEPQAQVRDVESEQPTWAKHVYNFDIHLSLFLHTMILIRSGIDITVGF